MPVLYNDATECLEKYSEKTGLVSGQIKKIPVVGEKEQKIALPFHSKFGKNEKKNMKEMCVCFFFF